MIRTFVAAITACSIAASPAVAQSLVAMPTPLGQVLAAATNNMTLYTFDNDAQNLSNCYESCADAWPPFLASETAQPEGALGIIERRDGTRQWAIKGQPLYFWQGDTAPGDTTGDGVGGVWHVVNY
ncbi:MAG: hypothetical protein AAGF30_03140 [Pseudomonadota bacterium]